MSECDTGKENKLSAAADNALFTVNVVAANLPNIISELNAFSENEERLKSIASLLGDLSLCLRRLNKALGYKQAELEIAP